MKVYFTFGQSHVHMVDDVLYHKDVVAVMEAENEEEARKRAFQLWGPKWFTSYPVTPPDMAYFPGGFVEVPNETVSL